MRKSLSLAVVLVTWPGAAAVLAVDLPSPPAGFSWVEFSEIKGAFLLPDGWHFRQEKRGGTLAYFLTRERIEADRPFETGMTLNVVPEVSKKTGRRAPDYAGAFAAALSGSEELLDSWQKRFGTMELYGARVRSAREGLEPLIMHRLSIGNATTDTLYIIVFESPERSWQEMWRLGDVMLSMFLLDDEV